MSQHTGVRRRLLTAALGLASVVGLGAGTARGEHAADRFPSRPVTLVVPYPAQGATDIGARIVAPALSQAWEQPVLVENRAGTSGTVGAEYVAHAPPDGHVLLMGSLGALAIAPTLLGMAGHDPSRELVPVSMVADLPMVLVVTESVRARSVTELVTEARARPGVLSYGSSGPGHPRHVAAEIFKQATRTDIRHVPLRGGGPLLVELRAGRIDVAFLMLIEAEEGLRQGWLRPLAVSGPVRVPMLPDVPTLAETVVPGFDMGNWIGVLAPQGIAPARVERIADSVRDALARPDVADRFVALGGAPQSSSPARFAELISVERARYAALLRRRGIKAG